MNASATQHWLIVPAAGVGKRMQTNSPKQYLQILGQSVIDHTIERLLSFPHFKKVQVGISSTDTYWAQSQAARNPRVVVCPGGDERVETVLNAMRLLKNAAKPNDWIWVHDAARPCITQSDLFKLLELTTTDEVGGVLAVPVADTIKRVESGLCVSNTVDRSSLWRAFTPQVFRYEILHAALERAVQQRWPVTDESSAVELAGYTPKVVAGRSDNIKITQPGDLELAAFIMAEQKRNGLS